ncbi:MAG: sigma-70 family RNA polymerase sigma factor [Chitinophagales bacterium]|nr:sigma-70 family RNA polymerase sigma factor [Chitinophagales bacterium]HNI43580.1 sigma-70 family RNA polymerase sigma factor [Chitinophagales bacterium]
MPPTHSPFNLSYMLNNYQEPSQKEEEVFAPDLNPSSDPEIAHIADNEQPPVILSKEEKDSLFNKQILPHNNALYTYAHYLTKDPNECDELVQETMYKAYINLHQFQIGTSSKAWLFTILRNIYYNKNKQKARHPQIDYADIMDYHDKEIDKNPKYSELQDNTQQNKPLNLKDSVFTEMLSDEVIEAIYKINEVYRSAILLSDIEDMSYEEISEVLHIEIGTVKSRIARGRQQMRELLTDYATENGYKTPKGKTSKINKNK